MSIPTENLKEAIVTMLNQKQHIGMDCDLSCYQSHDGFFLVDYLYCEDTVKLLDLDEQQHKMLSQEEELIEIFETPEEAADFYLKLTGGRIGICGHSHSSKKRTLKDKVSSFDKEKYF